jgi:hypothetical protein
MKRQLRLRKLRRSLGSDRARSLRKTPSFTERSTC